MIVLSRIIPVAISPMPPLFVKMRLSYRSIQSCGYSQGSESDSPDHTCKPPQRIRRGICHNSWLDLRFNELVNQDSLIIDLRREQRKNRQCKVAQDPDFSPLLPPMQCL